MKKLIVLTSLLCISYFGKSQISFGGGITYDVGDKIGLRVLSAFDVDDSWRGQVSYSNFFSDWAIDLDAHYKLVEIGDFDEGLITPFAGFNINRDTDTDDTDMGINLGLNLSTTIEEYDIFLEPKVTIGGIGGLVISAGILF